MDNKMGYIDGLQSKYVSSIIQNSSNGTEIKVENLNWVTRYGYAICPKEKRFLTSLKSNQRVYCAKRKDLGFKI